VVNPKKKQSEIEKEGEKTKRGRSMLTTYWARRKGGEGEAKS